MADEGHTATATTTPAGLESSTPPLDEELARSLLADRYQVERRLGAGGMGVVYSGRDTQLDRAVAIKLVKRPAESPETQELLVREARAMAKLRHPNVVTVHDIGMAGDRLFIVMELVDGGTLADWLKAEPRRWRQVVPFFLQAARGLAAAHAAGIVHRDFKPENVLVGRDGVVRVTDFGVVRLLGDVDRGDHGGPVPGSSPTRTAGVVGTPGYIAPEILRGERVDARADGFSFCVALHAALHGARPFQAAAGADPLEETLGARRPIPAGRAPGWLQRIVARGLRTDPAERWSSMGALGAAIERELRRRRQAAIGVGLSALALAAAAAGIVARRDRPARPERLADLAQHQVTFDANATSLGLSPDGRSLAYVSQNRVRIVDLEKHREIEARPEVQVAYYVKECRRWLADSSALEILAIVDRSMTTVSDFQGLRIQRDDGHVAVVPRFFQGEYAPDGKVVADAQVVWDHVDLYRNGRLERKLEVPGSYSYLGTFDWAADGSWLLVGTTDGHVLNVGSLAADGSGLVHLFDSEWIEGQPPRTAPHGAGVLYLRPHSREESDLVFVPLAGARPAGASHVILEGLQADEFTIDRAGRRLAYTRSRQPSKLWRVVIDDPEGDAPRAEARRVLADASFKESASLSPDGTTIAYTARESQGQSVFTVAAAGGLPARVPGPEGNACAVAWSPDGTRLAFVVTAADGATSVWVSQPGGAARKLASANPSSCELHWAPQARIAVIADGQRNFTIVDPDADASAPLLRDEKRGWAFHPAWSRDGQVALLWNRDLRISDAVKGVYVVSADGQIERPLVRGFYLPLGWSRDGRWIYAALATEEDLSKIAGTIYRVPAAGGAAQPWLTLPIEENLSTCSMSPDARTLVCIAGGESDVWLVDGLETILPG